MKNIVFMTAVKVPEYPLRSKPYDYGISSWKKWCDNHNAELVVLDKPLHDDDVMKINFHRYYCFDILENSGIEYDKILLTDADCIIHPDCPNFFEMTEGKYTVTHADGSYDWLFRSMENYSKLLFNGETFDYWRYFNAGFQIIEKKHKPIFKELLDFYFEHAEEIIKIQSTYHVGTDQPIINFIVNLKHETKILPYQFCMVDLHRKGLLTDDLLYCDVMPGIYQFNAIPDNPNAEKTLYYMQKTYEKFYGKL